MLGTRHPLSAMAVMVLAVLLAACSPKRLAVDLVGSAMVGGSDSYATDNDPDLVKEALPFGLKTVTKSEYTVESVRIRGIFRLRRVRR